MPRGPRWTPQEIQLLREMVEQGATVEEIARSGSFPGRTHDAIRMQIERFSIVQQRKFKVEQIREAEVVGLENIVKRYVDAFNKICYLTEYDKTDLERFRIIFMAAWKYRDLFAEYERLKQVEEQMEEIRKRLEILETQTRASAKAE